MSPVGLRMGLAREFKSRFEHDMRDLSLDEDPLRLLQVVRSHDTKGCSKHVKNARTKTCYQLDGQF